MTDTPWYSPPTVRARVCEACHVWPCKCKREPMLPVYVEPTFRVERCLCGGYIVVYELTDSNIMQAVAGHNRTVGHKVWARTWV